MSQSLESWKCCCNKAYSRNMACCVGVTPPEYTSLSGLVELMQLRSCVSDNGLVVTPYRRRYNLDTGVAQFIDVHAIKNIHSSCWPVDDRVHRSAWYDLWVIQCVEVASQDNCRGRISSCQCSRCFYFSVFLTFLYTCLLTMVMHFISFESLWWGLQLCLLAHFLANWCNLE